MPPGATFRGASTYSTMVHGETVRMALPTEDYFLYGLRVRSTVPLSGWPTLPADEAQSATDGPDVFVLQSALTTPEMDATPYAARTVLEGGDLRLAIGGVGRYWATGGSHIHVDAVPGARPEDVQLYLTGAVMGAILHQRGLFPLHASCVAIGGHGIAFAGPSGAGKSTLVTALVHRGAAFVSDDICVLAPSANGGFGVWPSAARTKLDQAALSALNQAESPLNPAGGDRGKFLLPVDQPAEALERVPLRILFLLRDAVGPPRLEKVGGLEAVAALVEETYFLRWAGGFGLAQQCFGQAAALARNLQTERLLRPRGFQHLQDVVRLIEAEARLL